MAFEASAPPLPGYESLPDSQNGKPSSSGPGESSHGNAPPNHYQNVSHSLVTPTRPEEFRGFVADPHQHSTSGYVAGGPHHQPGYVLDPRLQQIPDQWNPQHTHPTGAPVVFGFPVRPPPSSPHWNTGLCGCCADPGICLLGLCFPCYLLGKIAEELDNGATSCVAAGAIWYVLQQFTCCGWIFSHGYRGKLRSRYGMRQRPCCDCIVHCCCWHCAFCQEWREIQIRRFKDEDAWQRRASMAPPPQQMMRS